MPYKPDQIRSHWTPKQYLMRLARRADMEYEVKNEYDLRMQHALGDEQEIVDNIIADMGLKKAKPCKPTNTRSRKTTSPLQ